MYPVVEPVWPLWLQCRVGGGPGRVLGSLLRQQAEFRVH